MDDLKSIVTSYISVEDKIDELSSQSKTLRENKKAYEDQIIDYMVKNNITDFSTNNGKIKLASTKTQQGISKRILLDVMSDVLDEKLAASFLEEIENRREVKIVNKLKRVKAKEVD